MTLFITHVFSPNGAATYQPRATPWVNGPPITKP